MTSVIEHKDRLGLAIRLGDVVAYPHNNTLHVGIVIKMNPKMIKVKHVVKKSRFEPPELNRYPRDCVILRGPEVTMFLLNPT